MESFATDQFPGFQTMAPGNVPVATRKPPLSRLQRRAPGPLQLKPAAAAAACECRSAQEATSAAYFSSKDPIPLLSPLVLPSMVLESPVIQQEAMAESH